MSDSNFGEKAGFIVALFAAFIALNFYSDFFSNVGFLFGSYKYPLISVFNGMLAILFLCVYFYALDYTLDDSTKTKLFFRHFKSIGNFLYALSLIILPLAIFAHILSYFISLLDFVTKNYQFIISIIFSILGGLLGFIFSYFYGRSITKKQKIEEVKIIQTNEEKSIKQAEELYKNGFYAPSLIEMGKLIEIVLQKKLLEKKDLDVRRYNLVQLLDLALKSGLIDSKIANSIKDIRGMRNKAAHLDVNFTKKDAEWALEQTNEILKKLDPKNKWD